MPYRLEEVTDAGAWDAFVLSRDEYSITHSWAWGELKGAFGWRPRRFVLLAGDVTVAGAQVLGRPIPLLGGELWYAPRGFLVDWQDAAALAELTAALRTAGRRAGAAFVKVEPMAREGRDPAVLEGLGYRRAAKGIQPRHTLYLDLTKSEDELLAGMDRGTRYNVNLAGRKGVTVRAAGGRDELASFYDLLHATTDRKHFLVHNLAYYRETLARFGATSTLLFAERDGETLAAAFVLGFGRYAYYAHAATADLGRELKASNRLVWEAVRWARGRGFAVFDFWGIPAAPAPGNPLYGVYTFKMGFGGEVVAFAPPYDLPLSPVKYRLINAALALQAAWRNLRARGTFHDPMAE